MRRSPANAGAPPSPKAILMRILGSSFFQTVSPQVVAVEAVGAEERPDVLAIGDGRVGGVAAVAGMVALVRTASRAVCCQRTLPVSRSRASTTNFVLAGGAGPGNGGGEEDAFAGDDGCGETASGDGDFPGDVVRVAPFGGGVSVGNAVEMWAAPLEPIAGPGGEMERSPRIAVRSIFRCTRAASAGGSAHWRVCYDRNLCLFFGCNTVQLIGRHSTIGIGWPLASAWRVPDYSRFRREVAHISDARESRIRDFLFPNGCLFGQNSHWVAWK